MPIQLDAKLNAFRRSSKGFYITLEIGPDSDWTELAAAPLGQPFGVAMIPYDAETGKASPGELPSQAPAKQDTGQRSGEAGKPRKPFHEMSRAQQAGILCNDQAFKLWLSAAYPNTANMTSCADAVRLLCDVVSRSELSEDRVAGKKWDQLVTNFFEATGRMAEAR
jgi:hypothetical protein